MTDKELLELAAKAAGIDIKRLPDAWPDRFDDNQWNPLEDDGDALRLMVNLDINVYTIDDAVFSGTKIVSYNTRDINESVRHAIVRAAAEIGKAMK